MAMRISCQKPDRQGGPLPPLALPDGRASDTLFLTFRSVASATHGRGSSNISVLPRIAFANAGSLAAKIAQVVKLGAANVALLHHVDVIDDRGMQRKDSFDADTKTGLANSYGFTHAAVLTCDANPFECLQTFFR